MSGSKTKVRLPTRKDPTPRDIGGTDAWGLITGRDESRAYVWVDKGNQLQMSKYKVMGYRIECYDPDGELEPAGYHNLEGGDEIEMMGCFLMSIDKERLEAIRRPGIERADRIERAMIREGGIDGFRGQNNRYFGYETSKEHGRTETYTE